MLKLSRVLPAQAEQLLQFAESTFRAGFGHLNDPEHFEAYMAQAFTLEKITTELNTLGSEFYFAHFGGELAGYIKLNYGLAQSDLRNEPGMELERIYVEPRLQGRQIGQYLLGECLRIAAEGDFPYLWLGVWEKNEAAIRFYQRHGFVSFGSHTFMLGNDAQTDLLMKREL